MNRFLKVLIAIAIVGCDSKLGPPSVLQEAELKNHVTLERADPIDPMSVLFTVHQDGRVTWKGKSLTPEEMAARAPRRTSEVNLTPILIDAAPDAPFHVVRDLLAVLTGKPGCVNFAFLVSTPHGPGELVFPMQAERGMGYHLYEGRSGEKHIGGTGTTKQIDMVVSAGKDGQIVVGEINLRVPCSEPEIYFPKAGERPEYMPKPPNYSWNGSHPPLGTWSLEMLKSFLARRDVLEHSPYIIFKITTQEHVSEVLRCLATLKLLSDIVVLPEIPAKH
jgi:hypothetical protein